MASPGNTSGKTGSGQSKVKLCGCGSNLRAHSSDTREKSSTVITFAEKFTCPRCRLATASLVVFVLLAGRSTGACIKRARDAGKRDLKYPNTSQNIISKRRELVSKRREKRPSGS